ncbi:MAG: hypothetical protein D6799_01300, partial [Bacteroidetes bacterium]
MIRLMSVFFIWMYFLFSLHIAAQERPAHFSISAQKISNDTYKILFKVKIDEPWHIYSLNQNPDDGPMPTSIKFDKSNDYELIGKTQQSKGIKEMDKVFQVEVEYFSGKAEFWQEIKIKRSGKIKVSGTYEYQACTEEKCIFPPPEPFEIYINADIPSNSTTSVLNSTAVTTGDKLSSSVQPITGSEQNTADSSSAISTANTTNGNVPDKADERDIQANSNGIVNINELSLWMVFIQGFLGGLAALFTPCVFPLIPMNISFFTKRHKDRRKAIKEASLYSISIVAIYLLLGIFVTLIFGAGALNDLSTN